MINRRVEELQATAAQQQKQMEILTAQLREQAKQIERVNTQLALTKPAPQLVGND
jgi:uncharacterized coiled-coil protein SlyX